MYLYGGKLSRRKTIVILSITLVIIIAFVLAWWFLYFKPCSLLSNQNFKDECKSDNDCCDGKTKCKNSKCLYVNNHECENTSDCYSNTCHENKCKEKDGGSGGSGGSGGGDEDDEHDEDDEDCEDLNEDQCDEQGCEWHDDEQTCKEKDEGGDEGGERKPVCPPNERCSSPFNKNRCRVFCKDIHPDTGNNYSSTYSNHDYNTCNIDGIYSTTCANRGGIKDPPEDNIVWCDKCDEQTPPPPPPPPPPPSPPPPPGPPSPPVCPPDERCPTPSNNTCRVLCKDIHPDTGNNYSLTLSYLDKNTCNIDGIPSNTCENRGGILTPSDDNIFWCDKCDE